MLLISILLTIIGVIIVIYKEKELPESISAIALKLSKKWIWTIWIALITIFITPDLLLGKSGYIVPIIAASMIVCLAITAAKPLIPGNKNTEHYLYGFLVGILSQIYIIITNPWCCLIWLTYIPLTSGIWKWCEGKSVFFMEVLCALSLFGSLLL